MDIAIPKGVLQKMDLIVLLQSAESVTHATAVSVVQSQALPLQQPFATTTFLTTSVTTTTTTDFFFATSSPCTPRNSFFLSVHFRFSFVFWSQSLLLHLPPSSQFRFYNRPKPPPLQPTTCSLHIRAAWRQQRDGHSGHDSGEDRTPDARSWA